MQRDRGREEFDILGSGEHKEVAAAMEIDFLAGPLGKVRKEVQRPLAEHDVEFIGEVSAHPAGSPRCGPTGEFTTLDEHDIDTCFGEMDCRRRTHHTAPDDDHVSGCRQRHRWKPGSYGNSMTSICAF